MISSVKIENIIIEDSEKKNFCDTNIPLYNLQEISDDHWVRANK